MIRLVADIELALSSDASDTRYRAAMPLSVSPERTTCDAPEPVDAFDVVGDVEVVDVVPVVPPVAPLGRSSFMPGTIRLDVDSWFARSSADNETR